MPCSTRASYCACPSCSPSTSELACRAGQASRLQSLCSVCEFSRPRSPAKPGECPSLNESDPDMQSYIGVLSFALSMVRSRQANQEGYKGREGPAAAADVVHIP